jgi:hypothetical protein
MKLSVPDGNVASGLYPIHEAVHYEAVHLIQGVLIERVPVVRNKEREDEVDLATEPDFSLGVDVERIRDPTRDDR